MFDNTKCNTRNFKIDNICFKNSSSNTVLIINEHLIILLIYDAIIFNFVKDVFYSISFDADAHHFNEVNYHTI